MIRLLGGALAVSAVTGLLLFWLSGPQEVVVWSVVLLSVVIWQTRSLPPAGEVDRVSLFGSRGEIDHLLPRSVSTVEFWVVDVVDGHLPPDRRLMPLLRRLAAHRLQRRGLTMDSPPGREAMGAETWDLLNGDPARPVDVRVLESVVSRLESL